MGGKVTFKISSAAAPYLGAEKPKEQRLRGASGQVPLPPTDLVLLLYYLCHDPEPEVKRTALATLAALDSPFLSRLLSDRELHPRILDALLQLHHRKRDILPLFAAHPALSERSALLLARQGFPAPPPHPGGETRPVPQEKDAAPEEGARQAPGDAGSAAADADADAPADGESEEFHSKYQLAQSMGVGEKIKAALTGDKEWRSILIKDPNKLVSSSVIKNPRLTESEVLAIAKSSVQNEEIMRIICANKEWVKNPMIRKALVENHKTPLQAALRFVATLSEKELSSLAKSKNISSVIVSQARRILLSKKDGR